MSKIPDITRREFLSQGAALASLTALPMAVCAEETIRSRLIPGTDESLPVIGLGAPDFFYKSPPEGDDAAKAVIRALVEMGGKFLDTPPFFRPDPPVIGRLLTEMGLQDDLFLTGKITVAGKEEGIRHLERSVANLNKNPIDLLMVHNMRDMATHWPTLKDWKAAGKVRYIGVSLTRTLEYNDFTTNSDLADFMQAEKPDFIMPSYSAFHPEVEERVLPQAADSGIAVIVAEPFKALDDGSFFAMVADKPLPAWASEFDCESWAQFMLKFIVAHPAVTSVVTETSKVKHMIDNMRAGYGRLPDQAMRRKMREYLLAL